MTKQEEQNKETHAQIRRLSLKCDEPSNEIEIMKVCAVDYRFNGSRETDRMAEIIGKIQACRGRVLRECYYEADPISDNNPWGDLGTFKIVFE